jgi:hypothetical protein
MASAGMQQPQGQQGAPIAQQVMQQAAQESQGLEALPSNLPQEYAGGGIIAFEGGGEVQRFQTGGTQEERDREAMLETIRSMKAAGMDITTLPGRGMLGAFESGVTRPLRAMGVPIPYLPKSVYGGDASSMTPYMDELRRQRENISPTLAATPTAETKYDPETATRRSMYPEQIAPPPVAPLTTPKIPSGSGFKMPNFETYTPTAAVLPERTAPVLADYGTLIGDMPKKTKDAFDAARTTEEKYLRDLTEPGEKAREEKFSKREATLEKDSAMGRALNLINLGFGIAGSKERTVAGALNKEGREGIADLIRGEAANRVAKERLEDARDNFEQQKIAAKKGDRSAATAAGQRAADDLRAGTQLTMTASHYGNTEANQRLQIQQQGDIGRGQLFYEGERQKMTAVEQRNRNLLAEKELGLRSKELDLNSAFRNEQLKIMKNKYDSLDPYQAAQLRAKAEERVDPIAVRSQLAKQLGLSKVPAPGADKGFDSKFDTLYQNEVASHFNRFLGIGGGSGAGPNPYDGFKLVP